MVLTSVKFRSKRFYSLQKLSGEHTEVTDIIVGTHRLISKDIQFKDLGLIIVDEEQRFGVGQKEKLKELYPDMKVYKYNLTHYYDFLQEENNVTKHNKRS